MSLPFQSIYILQVVLGKTRNFLTDRVVLLYEQLWQKGLTSFLLSKALQLCCVFSNGNKYQQKFSTVSNISLIFNENSRADLSMWRETQNKSTKIFLCYIFIVYVYTKRIKTSKLKSVTKTINWLAHRLAMTLLLFFFDNGTKNYFCLSHWVFKILKNVAAKAKTLKSKYFCLWKIFPLSQTECLWGLRCNKQNKLLCVLE